MYLVFNVTRAFRLQAVLPELQGERYPSLERSDPKHPYPNVIAIDGRRGDAQATRLPDVEAIEYLRSVQRVLVAADGETPDLVHLVYESTAAPGQPPQHWFALAELCPTAESPELVLGALEPFTGDVFARILSPDLVRRRIDDWLDARPLEPLTPYQRFFTDMDARTHAYLIANAPDPLLSGMADTVGTWTSRIGQRLADRIQRRTQHVAPGPATVEPLLDAGDRGYLVLLSRWFLDIIRRHAWLVDANGAIQLAAFESAFELFASGALRFEPAGDGAVACQPSSSNYLHFAEFGILAYEYGVDAQDWFPLLNVLVRSQEIYLRAYAPARPFPRMLDQYTACNYDPARGGHSPQERVDLAQGYVGLGYLQLWDRATLNARAAIAGP